MYGRPQSACRAICYKTYGPPPEPWYEAAHTCGKGTEACVNPRHLRWATPADNRADKRHHGTALIGTRNPLAKLTDAQVAYVKRMRGKVKQTDLARELGVSHVIISRIYSSGRAYAVNGHVEERDGALHNGDRNAQKIIRDWCARYDFPADTDMRRELVIALRDLWAKPRGKAQRNLTGDLFAA